MDNINLVILFVSAVLAFIIGYMAGRDHRAAQERQWSKP